MFFTLSQIIIMNALSYGYILVQLWPQFKVINRILQLVRLFTEIGTLASEMFLNVPSL